MAFWDWERWEKEIDWMILHGINMPLMVIGEEPDKIESLPEGQWNRNWRISSPAAVDDSELGKTVLRIKGKFPSSNDNSVLIMIKMVF